MSAIPPHGALNEAAVKSLSPRDHQKILIAGVLVVTFSYILFTKWVPDLLYYLRSSKEKKNILKHVQTEGVKKATTTLQQMETKKEEIEKETQQVEEDKIQQPNFVLKRKTASTSKVESGNTPQTSDSDDVVHTVEKEASKLIRRKLPELSPYASPPVIHKTDEEIALEKSRKLRKQQDLAYQRSVEEDEKKLKAEQELQAAKDAKIARIETIKATVTKKRAFTEEEVTVKLSFRFGKSASAKGTSKIRNGDILDNTVTLKNVMGIFATTDTVEYLMDFVEAQESIMKNRPNNTNNIDDNHIFELTLSYPNRVINRQLNPTTTLNDLHINDDSVVWVTFL